MIASVRCPAAWALALAASAWPALAQPRDSAAAYPSRPVRIVVPFGAGSGPDVRSRQLAQKLAADWQQPVIVENRPGAGGQLAMEHVAHASADGYTLVMAGQSAVAIAPHLARLRYDPLKDFAAVTRTSQGAIILVVHPGLPAKDAMELAAHARRHPEKLFAASWGSGTITHLALELFMRSAGVRIVHVPYKSAGQALGELSAGQIQLAFEFFPAVGPSVQASRLRAIAVSGRARLPALPEVPTFTESGLPALETVSGWQGVAVPAATPGAIVSKVHAAVVRALAWPDVRASYHEAGFETVGDTPERFAAFLRAEHARWGKLIAEAGIRGD